mmetsp:Transcript_18671/g.26282  ORF Transcript_18671/g.26282 Transcript_18671/m.26282 type:complete len:93 (+) Transcript_18671:118-396(+)
MERAVNSIMEALLLPALPPGLEWANQKSRSNHLVEAAVVRNEKRGEGRDQDPETEEGMAGDGAHHAGGIAEEDARAALQTPSGGTSVVDQVL